MSDVDHNLGGIAADQLCGYVSRIERVEEEINGLNDDKSELYGEAKACGFDVPTLKNVIRRRRKDRFDIQDEDALLHFYEDLITTILGRPKTEVNPLA